MRICRVALSYPTTNLPSAGLVGYYLCKHIKEPSIYITVNRNDGNLLPPTPNFAIQLIDVPLEQSSHSLNHSIHKSKQNIFQRLYIYFKIILTLRSIRFLLSSIPKIIFFKPDIICCHANVSLYHGLFFYLFYRTKFVVHIHAMSDAIAISNLSILRCLVNRASRIYCISDAVMNKLKYTISSNKLRLTSTGVDPNVFYNLNTKRKKQIIQVGQLMWYKGHNYILKAMPDILLKHPDYKLIIVGKGRLKKEISEYIKNNKLTSSVKMIPFLSHDELRVLYNESMLLVMPSLFEGLPKVLLEAFSCGLPAVITKSCNANNISDGRAMVVDKESSKALSKAVCDMLDNQLRWEKFSINCLNIIETHDWQKISKSIHKDYRELL